MSLVFVDTSAMIALLIDGDTAHERARRSFDRLQGAEATLVTTSYVLVETYALLARRVGVDAVRAVRHVFEPLLKVIWVDRSLHERALDFVLERDSRDLSLVDAASLLVIRDERLEQIFAYDRHFEQAGLPPIV